MFLIRDDDFVKLFTILEQRRMREREVLHSDLSQGSKLRGDEICPTAKVVLTGDDGADSVRDIGDDRLKNKVEIRECKG